MVKQFIKTPEKELVLENLHYFYGKQMFIVVIFLVSETISPFNEQSKVYIAFSLSERSMNLYSMCGANTFLLKRKKAMQTLHGA